MLSVLHGRIRGFCSRIRWLFRWKPNKNSKLRRSKSKSKFKSNSNISKSRKSINVNHSEKPIRIATFNAALFTLAPAVLPPPPDPRNVTKSKQKVSINLPENEISLSSKNNGDHPLMRSPISVPATNWMNNNNCKTIFDVLKEVNADIIALQDVKAEEEKEMRPLSELAKALGMNYVFAESWAPQYGNSILSKWPIQTWNVQTICDDNDFRNVLKATIEIPWGGVVDFYCTQLDHLDENWRLKQINAIIDSSEHPHILAGGLNSLDFSDYSIQRWTDIVKYFEEIGKPTPKVQVTNFLKEKQYIDAKEYPGECEPVVMIAKGQSVQGTCKYGTRIDYIMASQGLDYKFMAGSYSVVSSKGTSDHHLVKVDIIKAKDIATNIRRIKHNKLIKLTSKRLSTYFSSILHE